MARTTPDKVLDQHLVDELDVQNGLADAVKADAVRMKDSSNNTGEQASPSDEEDEEEARGHDAEMPDSHLEKFKRNP